MKLSGVKLVGIMKMYYRCILIVRDGVLQSFTESDPEPDKLIYRVGDTIPSLSSLFSLSDKDFVSEIAGKINNGRFVLAGAAGKGYNFTPVALSFTMM